MTTTPVHIDPRIRSRRIEVQREAGRRRLRVVLVVMGLLCALGIAYLVVTSPLLDIDRVRVVGTDHVTADQVQAAAHVHLHSALLFADTAAIAHRVERLSWVAHATVTRSWPGTLQISITEYTPVAFIKTGPSVLLVAPTGVVVARAAAPSAGAVEVRGVRQAPVVGDTLSPPDAASVVGEIPSALASRVVAVDVSEPGLALDLAHGGEIRLGGTNDLDAKSAAALAVLAHLGSASFRYIDVSAPDRPVSG